MWEFQANVAHNNKCQGIFVWQNSAGNHIINDFIAYRNGAFGVTHGAYKNNYVHVDFYLVESGEGESTTTPTPSFPGADFSSKRGRVCRWWTLQWQ